MKKILFTTIIVSSLFCEGFFDGVENPNGRPFMLNVDLELFEEHSSWEVVYNLNIKMPITQFLTLKGGVFSDGGVSDANMQIWSWMSGETYNSPVSLSHTSYQTPYIGAEVHIPLYKLWEK